MQSQYTLGLDLGSNSIGWSVIDEAANTVVAGVRVFPEGVDRDTKGSEVPKNAQRRTARSQRRLIARRARRKRNLRRVLTDLGWLPSKASEQLLVDNLNPYDLRKKGLTTPLTLAELARALIHLNQRRGFLSNRKSDRSAKPTEQSKLLESMTLLQKEIDSAGCSTLGEFLAQIHAQDALSPIRGKHTRRAMFETEFDLLWNTQAAFHPKELNSEARDRIKKIIFFQRKMYWPASSIGKCELEPRHERCSRADRLHQKVRMLLDVNNLRILDPRANERTLTPEERASVLNALGQKDKLEFEKLKKLLKLPDGYSFNYESGDRKSLPGLVSDYQLAKVFGKCWWEKAEQDRDRIIRFLINYEDEEAKVRQVAESDWKLSADDIAKLLKTFLPEGRARFSRKAMQKLLPHLESGLPLMSMDGTESAMSVAGYDRPDQKQQNPTTELPLPPFITNPIVRQGLFEVRKVINAIIKEYGKPARIHIELAREIKGNAEKRRKIIMEQNANRDEREKAAAIIQENNDSISLGGDTITRFRLWKQQREVCIYSGQPISFAQLYNGDTQIDHILPYSRSLDDSLMNKVVVFRTENDDKGNQTPREWLEGSQKNKYEQVLQRAAYLPYPKRKRFSQKEVELDKFLARQLVDTQYISREVARYVRTLGVEVICTKGGKTADLRYLWGLNDLLNATGENKKTRDDHRHHAVDAIVIALTDRKRLHQLSRRYEGGTLDEPWSTFRQDVIKAIEAINVSHRSKRRISGALHNDTFYGATEKPDHFVYRKPLKDLSLTEVKDIRDHVVKKVIIERLKSLGIDIEVRKSKIPKNAFEKPVFMPTGSQNQGKAVEIKKVRIIEKNASIKPIRFGRSDQAFVKPNNLHHVCVFEICSTKKGKLFRKRVFKFYSLLDVVKRRQELAKQGKLQDNFVSRVHPEFPDAKYLFSLHPGDMVFGQFKGQQRLVVFSTGSSTEERKLEFYDHRDARKTSGPDKREILYASRSTFDGWKVEINALGRLRWSDIKNKND